MAEDESHSATKRLEIEICTPERPAIALTAEEVILPGEKGVFAVLRGHTPLLTTLTQGTMIAYSDKDSPAFYAINGGFAEVLNDRVLILTHTIEHAEEIDVERARTALERAETRLKKPEGIDIIRAEAALARAVARIQAHEHEDYS